RSLARMCGGAQDRERLLLAVTEPREQLRRRRGERRVVREGGPERDERKRHVPGKRTERVERRRVLDPEASDARPAEAVEMRDGAERATDVLGEDTHVRPLGAPDVELHPVRGLRRERERGDLDLARRALYLDPPPGELVERNAVALERRG